MIAINLGITERSEMVGRRFERLGNLKGESSIEG
jgi:hypothetical protein